MKQGHCIHELIAAEVNGQRPAQNEAPPLAKELLAGDRCWGKEIHFPLRM